MGERVAMLLMYLGAWRRLTLARRGVDVHVTTYPLCIFYRAPRPGSRLDRASRGIACPRCPR